MLRQNIQPRQGMYTNDLKSLHDREVIVCAHKDNSTYGLGVVQSPSMGSIPTSYRQCCEDAFEVNLVWKYGNSFLNLVTPSPTSLPTDY